MADDIAKPNQDPRDVATTRRNQGMIRRAQERELQQSRQRLAVTGSGGSGAGGGGGGGRALVPSGGDRLPAPSGGGGGRDLVPSGGGGSSSTRGGPGTALVKDNRIPLNLGSIPRPVRGLGLGILGAMPLDSTPTANATLTGTPEGRRLLADDAARRTMAPGYDDAASEAAAALRSNNSRRNTSRSNARMSPREIGADEMNNISLKTLDPESGISEMRGVRGEIARNIINRRAELEPKTSEGMKKGGPVKKMAKGGMVKASTKGMKPAYKMAGGGAARADGCATRGKTKGRMV